MTSRAEIVPGPDDGLVSVYTYLDEDGQPLLRCTKRKLRLRPPQFGEVRYEVTTRDAELGLRFLTSIGFRGFGHVEFKRDALVLAPALAPTVP